MSVIAWDGRTVAADKRSVHEGLIRETVKLFMIDEETVVGFVGTECQGLALVEWYKSGAVKSDYPKFQTVDDWTRLLVFKTGSVYFYESEPYPIKVYDHYMAWGSGRDYALAAMYLGKDARGAIGVSSVFDNNCGNGVTAFDMRKPVCPIL